MSLWSDFLRHDQRLIDKWTHYFPVYERHFGRYVNRPLLFIEIGCGEGGSLQMWKRYFGPGAQIVGLDIRPECAALEERQIAVRIGDQADPAFLDRVLAEFGTPDIVLDDGSHVMSAVTASFRHLYPRTDRNGIYAVEDMHTAYWPQYGGGLRRQGTFIELAKGLIDELNAEFWRGAAPPSDFSRTTLSMHFYDSQVIFERGRLLPRRSEKIGG
ncbi:MAG: class I SAM-dependent methyltransferase [Rhodospirillales bacterium]|jgi:SAM-dependent methyltransferase|nr:class I SAM-dependent methyltransferase [Rhodospirillales bacterium]